MASVSIIMPAYNSQGTIQESIDSVMNQTYQNWELLVVDDGSNDQTRDIIKQNIKQDNRIKLIESDHGGPGGAKNRGIEAAKGEYIAFIDSDDLFDSNFIQIGVDKLKKGYDCVIYDYIRFNDNNNKEVYRVEATPYGSFSAAWNKMYNSKLWMNIKFPEKVTMEDIEVVPVVVKMATNVTKITDCYYYYRMRETSITHDYDSSKVSEIKFAIELLLENLRIFTNQSEYESDGELIKFCNHMMYLHLKKGVKFSNSRMKQKKICDDLIPFYRKFNIDNFNLNKALYSKSISRQLRNDILLILFYIRCYTIGIWLIEKIEGKVKKKV